MGQVANVALTDTFNTWRIRSNESFTNLFEINPSANTVSANTITTMALTTTGNTDFTGGTVLSTANVNLFGNTNVVKGTTFTVQANTTFSGANTNITGDILATGNTKIHGIATEVSGNALTVSANVTLSGANTNITGDILASGNALTVQGNTTFSGANTNVSSSHLLVEANTKFTGTTIDIDGKLHTTATEVVVNDDQADINFRIESDTTDDLLFADAGDRFVSFGKQTNTLGEAGVNIDATGQIMLNRDSAGPLLINRITDDGSNVLMYRDGVIKATMNIQDTASTSHMALSFTDDSTTNYGLMVAQGNAYVTAGDISPDTTLIYAALTGYTSSGNALTGRATSTPQSTVMFSTTENESYGVNLVEFEVFRSGSSSYDFLETQSDSDGDVGVDVEHRLRGDGNAYADGTWSGGGAGFGEYWEWEDGNVSAEDRIGIPVAMAANNKTKIEQYDPNVHSRDDVLGVISGFTTIVGNNPLNWHSKNLRDEFHRPINFKSLCVHWTTPCLDNSGNPIIRGQDGFTPIEDRHDYILGYWDTEGVYHEGQKPEGYRVSWPVLPGDVTPPEDAIEYEYEALCVNPEYDPTQDYETREGRASWAIVSYLGIERVRTDKDIPSHWIFLRSISPTVHEYMVFK